MPKLHNTTTGEVLAEDVRVAGSWWERFAGLIPRKVVPPDEGLWFRDCWAIHTLFMQTKIDVIFLDAQARVVRTHASVKRNRFAVACFGANDVVELGAGALEGRDVLPGDRLELK